MTRILLVVVLVLAGLTSIEPSNQTASDKEAVRQAVLDYVEGIYTVDPARVERSVHPNLAKLGFYRPPADKAYRPGATMSLARLLEVAKNFNKEGKLPKDALKEVIIYEVMDQTATAKLVADWGVDYMHLAKFDGKWQIINVLWQSHPPKA
jgi:hypothetical protein